MTLHSELINIALFFAVIAKCLLMTGLGPSFLLAAAYSRWRPPLKRGHVYKISGYHYGDFIGEILNCDRDKSRVRVVDPLRPVPRAKNPCCYPACVREDFHGGDHGFVTVREGAVLEVSWALAKWTEIPQTTSLPSSAGRQLAVDVFIPANENSATSLPRKIRRYA